MTCLAAYTPPGSSYPPFINISEVPGGVRIIVRSPASRDLVHGHPVMGSIAEIIVEREVAQQLLGEALETLSCSPE